MVPEVSCLFISARCDVLQEVPRPVLVWALAPLGRSQHFMTYKSLEPRLHALRLVFDLARASLFLWKRALPAVLVLFIDLQPTASAFSRYARFARRVNQHLCWPMLF